MAPFGIVSGSGIALRPLLDEIYSEQPFREIAGLTHSPVRGHDGTFIQGRCGETTLVLQCGRLHAYEGLPFEDVVRTVDVMNRYGVDRILFTNAAGGLWPEMNPGDLVTAGCVRTWRYGSFKLPAVIDVDFRAPGCDFTGDYVWMHGPSYETRAEIAALQNLGAAVVGMSTAPELLRCHQLGIQAGLISCVTNSCCKHQVLTHAHVLDTAQRTSARLCRIIRQALRHGRRGREDQIELLQ